MRMAELSAESGVPIATIKYYLRENLLPAGERTSPNQARYDDGHVRRLKLIRALLDVGGLAIADVRGVVDAIDAQAPTHDLLDAAQQGLLVPKGEVDDEGRLWALARLVEVADRLNWELNPDDVSTQTVIGVLCTFRDLGHLPLLAKFADYAELAAQAALLDVTSIRDLPTPETMVESAVVGTVLGDALFSALRRLAQQNVSRELFS